MEPPAFILVVFSPTDNTQCYTVEEKKTNWYLSPGSSQFEICTTECASCTLGKDEITNERKNQCFLQNSWAAF